MRTILGWLSCLAVSSVATSALAQAGAEQTRPPIDRGVHVRLDALEKVLRAFAPSEKMVDCYDVSVSDEASGARIYFFPRQPPARDGQVTVYTGGVPGCGRAVGFNVDRLGHVTAVKMGRD